MGGLALQSYRRGFRASSQGSPHRMYLIVDFLSLLLLATFVLKQSTFVSSCKVFFSSVTLYSELEGVGGLEISKRGWDG